MNLFETILESEHEQIVLCNNKDAGLHAIIAIHNTIPGPALGGTRMWPYASEDEAIRDVLRLSRGMTYKAAVSGLNLGAGHVGQFLVKQLLEQGAKVFVCDMEGRRPHGAGENRDTRQVEDALHGQTAQIPRPGAQPTALESWLENT